MTNPTSGTITNWTITINYTVPVPQACNVVTGYRSVYQCGGNNSLCRAEPRNSIFETGNIRGKNIYRHRHKRRGMHQIANVNVTVNPTPVVSVTADYCARAGYVRLAATSTPAGATYFGVPGSQEQQLTSMSPVITP